MSKGCTLLFLFFTTNYYECQAIIIIIIIILILIIIVVVFIFVTIIIMRQGKRAMHVIKSGGGVEGA